MKDYRFAAMCVPAYFDEDTVYDSEMIEFSLFDIRGSEEDVFYVATMHGQTEYLAACYKESVRPLFDTGVPSQVFDISKYTKP